MASEGRSEGRRGEAAAEWNQHEGRRDGTEIVRRLDDGLSLLEESLYRRMHQDVERVVGRDSMIMPLSETKTERAARREIDLYQIAVSAAMNREKHYADPAWYPRWLARLRLGPSHEEPGASRRLADYLARDDDQRRLAFSDVLGQVLPESRRAPLVLFRLAPLAVCVVTARALGDRSSALALREEQKALHPPIADCRACRGKLLEGDEPCPECGNPLWKFEWLTVAE